ncbi:ras association domain-containing protein 8 isoform X3 [Rhipicephalus microplus]|uniref:ras association domain-containing protein 8 isoform X3 n=1 Tax=Rhipicephalus microplus TaxID=6941 RepID=UPI003F6AFE72
MFLFQGTLAQTPAWMVVSFRRWLQMFLLQSKLSVLPPHQLFHHSTLPDGSMELRVWLEGGPQRVVCGVTEATTCQDVVYALAQATAQTGRFALVERSRRSERPLAPSDRPLRLLARWGRCASDVHFLLRRCGPAKAATPPHSGVAVQASLPLERVSHRPRRPPPYDEAVTRLAAGTHHLLPSRGGDPPLQGLGDSPSKQQPPDDYSELLRVVSLQREHLHKVHEELAQKDAVFCPAELSTWEEAPLEEQLHLSRQEERTLHSELTLARSQLATCEARLLQCRQRLCQLGHEGLGQLEGFTYHLQLKPDVPPTIEPARRITVALEEPVKAKLDEMERDGVITKVKKPCVWSSHMVVVIKNEKVRICLDP